MAKRIAWSCVTFFLAVVFKKWVSAIASVGQASSQKPQKMHWARSMSNAWCGGCHLRFFRFDVNRHCRTNCLTQFTHNTRSSPFDNGVARARPRNARIAAFLFGEINWSFRAKKVLSVTPKAFYQFTKQKGFTRLAISDALFRIVLTGRLKAVFLTCRAHHFKTRLRSASGVSSGQVIIRTLQSIKICEVSKSALSANSRR